MMVRNIMNIDNTEKAKNEVYKNRYGAIEYEMSLEDIALLVFGRCLVLDDGEYVSYITLKRPE